MSAGWIKDLPFEMDLTIQSTIILRLHTFSFQLDIKLLTPFHSISSKQIAFLTVRQAAFLICTFVSLSESLVVLSAVPTGEQRDGSTTFCLEHWVVLDKTTTLHNLQPTKPTALVNTATCIHNITVRMEDGSNIDRGINSLIIVGFLSAQGSQWQDKLCRQ